MTRELAAFDAHPALEGGDERRHPNLSHNAPLGRGQAVDVALDIEDRIDPAHRLDRERRLSNLGEHEQFASPVRPTRRLDDRTRLACGVVEIVEPGNMLCTTHCRAFLAWRRGGAHG
jgi:hypothetical protein